jgi:hypothetical protein
LSRKDALKITTFHANAREEAKSALEITLRLLAQASPTERRFGGVLCVLRRSSSSGFDRVLHEKIGEPPAEKVGRYELLSEEKPRRITRNPGHFLSWQTRCLANQEYQGGVRAEDGSGDWFAGFSGLTEEADECFIFIWLVRMRMLTFERAVALAKISNNQLFLHATVTDLLPLAV